MGRFSIILFITLFFQLSVYSQKSATILINERLVQVKVDNNGYIIEIPENENQYLYHVQSPVDVDNVNRINNQIIEHSNPPVYTTVIEPATTPKATSTTIVTEKEVVVLKGKDEEGKIILYDEVTEVIEEEKPIAFEESLSIVETNSIESIAPLNINFFPDDSSLNDEVKASLDSYIALLKKDSHLNMRITTFSYAEGETRRRLSIDRLNACKNYAASKGINYNKISIRLENGSINLVNTVRINIVE